MIGMDFTLPDRIVNSAMEPLFPHAALPRFLSFLRSLTSFFTAFVAFVTAAMSKPCLDELRVVCLDAT